MPLTPPSRPPSVVLLAVLGAACAARPAVLEPVVPAAPAIASYRLTVAGVFHTVAQGLDPDPWAAAPDQQTHMQLTVDLEPARTFRDGSVGTLVRFADVASGAGAGAPAALQGRTFELRTFEGREILTADLVEHVVGTDRGLDVHDLLLPAISPFPPALEVGQQAEKPMRWPVVVARDRSVRGAVAATWLLQGVEQVQGQAAWQFTYEGPWTSRLRDGAALGAASGQARGTVWIAVADGGLLRHEMQWSRQVRLRYPNAPAGPVEVVQDQSFTVQLQRVGP